MQQNNTIENSTNFETASVYTKQKATNVCGYSFDSLKKRLDFNLARQVNKELTDKQLKAQGKIIDDCAEWFDYLDSLDSA